MRQLLLDNTHVVSCCQFLKMCCCF